MIRWFIDRFVLGYQPRRQRKAIAELKCWCGDETKTNPHWQLEHGRWPS